MKSDQEIQNDVMEELRWQPLLNASEIGVAVKKGIVAISGHVDSYAKKLAAENAAKRVMGVKAVVQEINVKLSTLGKRTDEDIAEEVLNALKWHTSVPDEKLKLKVEEGIVTLEGEVNWEYQREAAKSAIKNLAGVKGIRNLIIVKTATTGKDIKEKIAAAFLRSATIDSEKVTVEIRGNKAVLSGKVRTWVEKEEAENVAWNAKGITSVENKLEVDTEIYAF